MLAAPAAKPHRKIGGSDVPKLLGISPYGGPFEVFERIYLGKEAEWNRNMERGAAVEPTLRALAQRMLGIEIEDVESDYHDHPTRDFARAQIDDLARWRGLPVAVDYKSQSRFAKNWGPDGSDEVPEHLRAQIAWEMACCDRELGLLVVGFGDDVDGPELFNITHVLTYQIERDSRFESYCMAVAEEFWNAHILTGVPPPQTKPVRKTRKKS